MILNIHAGHNPDGRTACGAAGILRESTEARRVKDEVIRRLRQLGHTVYDCTCDNGTDQTDVLKKIVAACNAHTVDLDVSIHFNSGAGDPAGNGATTGTEAWIYSAAGRAKKYAENICQAISAAGYRNRGVKVNPKLYVLRHTKAPAVLVECCFVDDRDDAARYNCQEMAAAIVYGITGQRITETDPETDETHPGHRSAGNPADTDRTRHTGRPFRTPGTGRIRRTGRIRSGNTFRRLRDPLPRTGHPPVRRIHQPHKRRTPVCKASGGRH